MSDTNILAILFIGEIIIVAGILVILTYLIGGGRQ